MSPKKAKSQNQTCKKIAKKQEKILFAQRKTKKKTTKFSQKSLKITKNYEY
jgi:hypothetical protein